MEKHSCDNGSRRGFNKKTNCPRLSRGLRRSAVIRGATFLFLLLATIAVKIVSRTSATLDNIVPNDEHKPTLKLQESEANRKLMTERYRPPSPNDNNTVKHDVKRRGRRLLEVHYDGTTASRGNTIADFNLLVTKSITKYRLQNQYLHTCKLESKIIT